MKKTMKRILSIFLVVMLLAALPMTQAFAAYDCQYGKYTELELSSFSGASDNDLVGRASIDSGNVPGMNIKISGDARKIQLVGTPTRPGSYNLGISFEMKDGQPGSFNITVNVSAVQPTISVTSSTTAPGKNENFKFTVSMTGGAPYTVTMFTKAGKDNDAVQGITWTLDGENEPLWFNSNSMDSDVDIYYYYFTVKNSAGTATSNNIAINNPYYTKPSPTPAAIKITKQPTGETVDEGGRAVFVARAENYDKFVWRIVSPDTNTTYTAKEAPNYFKGLTVSGQDTERLVLENIPQSMNGWKAECKFIAADGKTFLCTNGAVIRVNKVEVALKRPSITTQPSGVTKTVGEGATLSVAATDPNGGTLHYQWYSNTTASNNGGTQIAGATSASYTPPQTEGTVYYFASVWSSKDGRNSDRVNTGAVAVTYTAAAAATPVPAESAAPTTPDPNPSAVPSNEPNTGSNDNNSGNDNNTTGGNADVEIKPERSGNGLIVLLLVIAGLGLVAAAVLLILSKRDEKPKTVNKPAAKSGKAPAVKSGWTCPSCGEVNLGRFCQNCGAPKPANEPLYICDKCGWKPEDPTHPPRFCPECGDPFGPEDTVDGDKFDL